MRGSEWLSLRRCLAIVQRLQMGSASPAELMDFVRKAIGESAYPASPTAREKAFKRDRENLKKRLGVSYTYTPAKGVYLLLDAGALLQLNLSEESLRAILLLSETFGGAIGVHSNVRHLLDEVIGHVSPENKARLESPERGLGLNLLQEVDNAPIPKRVWVAAQKAILQHRKLTFHYISPSHADRQERLHQVAPIQIQYQAGHWY